MSQWSGHTRPGRGPQQTQHLGEASSLRGLKPVSYSAWRSVCVCVRMYRYQGEGGETQVRGPNPSPPTIPGKSGTEPGETGPVPDGRTKQTVGRKEL